MSSQVVVRATLTVKEFGNRRGGRGGGGGLGVGGGFKGGRLELEINRLYNSGQCMVVVLFCS